MRSFGIVIGGFSAWLAALSVAAPLAAQASLSDAASRARAAWMSHDAGALAGAGDSLVLRLPGVDEVAVGSSQAARLLSRYLEPAAERGFDLRTVKTTGEERGYAEAARRYVVRGTSDEVRETVYLGFRRAGGKWRLVEVRVTP